MRSPEDILAELESDIGVREEEIRLIQNLADEATTDKQSKMLRRSLVLLAYAHFEGFCRFALLSYSSAINAMKLPCKDACTPLVSSSLKRVFMALRNVDNKHAELDRLLPNDKDLHMLSRERSFVENYENIVLEIVEIPDNVVDTGSNLNSGNLKKNLYKLGLDYPKVEPHKGKIDKLLGIRNAIAHGDSLKSPKKTEVSEYTETAMTLMKIVQTEIYEALKRQTYLKAERETA